MPSHHGQVNSDSSSRPGAAPRRARFKTSVGGPDGLRSRGSPVMSRLLYQAELRAHAPPRRRAAIKCYTPYRRAAAPKGRRRRRKSPAGPERGGGMAPGPRRGGRGRTRHQEPKGAGRTGPWPCRRGAPLQRRRGPSGRTQGCGAATARGATPHTAAMRQGRGGGVHAGRRDVRATGARHGDSPARHRRKNTGAPPGTAPPAPVASPAQFVADPENEIAGSSRRPRRCGSPHANMAPPGPHAPPPGGGGHRGLLPKRRGCPGCGALGSRAPRRPGNFAGGTARTRRPSPAGGQLRRRALRPLRANRARATMRALSSADSRAAPTPKVRL